MEIPHRYTVDSRTRASNAHTTIASPYDSVGYAGRTVEEYPSGGTYARTTIPPQEEQFGQTICWLKDCIAGLHTVVDKMDYEM